MEECLLDCATLFELRNTESIYDTYRQIIKQAVMPTIQKMFVPRPWDFPIQFQIWLDTIRFYTKHKLLELQCVTTEDTYLTVTNTDCCIQLTFYPVGAPAPTLHLRTSTKQYFFTYQVPTFYARAAMAKSKNKENVKNKILKIRDSSIETIGVPSNLNNYLPDSGTTQHMTPRLADLIDMVEGQRLGVEVANGHVIKCSITGKIQINMQDDNRDHLNAILSDVMYVPGLSHRLFSVTQFAQHGHQAIVQRHGTMLLFGPHRAPVTIPYNKGNKTIASNLSIVPISNDSNKETYHPIPAYHNKDNNKK